MSKMRPLPETDLVEVAVLPLSQRRQRLEGINLGIPPHSYQPTRNSLPDLLNEQQPLFGPQPATPWLEIEKKLLRSPAKWIAPNLAVSKVLHKHVIEKGHSGRALGMTGMPLKAGVFVRYWAPTGLIVDGNLVVLFMNFRRKAMTAAGSQMVFSLMHDQIQTRYPDYIGARLAIYEFADDDNRTLRCKYADGLSLMPFSEQQQRIEETYRIWYEVLEGRTETARRAGGSGPLL